MRRERHRRQGQQAPPPPRSTRWAPTTWRRSTPYSGERCSPHPHNFTDRMLRPGDQAFFDILQSFVGYRTCLTTAPSTSGRATAGALRTTPTRSAGSGSDLAIDLVKPGVSTRPDRRRSGRRREDFRLPRRDGGPFGLQFGHGLGLALHERPIIQPARVVRASDGNQGRAWSSRWKPIARPRTASPPRGSRRRSVVTADGCKVIHPVPVRGVADRQPILIAPGAGRAPP